MHYSLSHLFVSELIEFNVNNSNRFQQTLDQIHIVQCFHVLIMEFIKLQTGRETASFSKEEGVYRGTLLFGKIIHNMGEEIL